MYSTDVSGVRTVEVKHWPQRSTSLCYTGRRALSASAIYSYRSGRGRKFTQMRIPDFSGTPASNAAETARFYRDFSESALSNEAASVADGQKRYATTDSGHEMFLFRFRCEPVYQTVTHLHDGATGRIPFVPAITAAANYRGISSSDSLYKSFAAHYPTLGASLPSFPAGGTTLDSTDKLNQLFSYVRESTPSANVGETVLELIRGGIPGLLSSTIGTLASIFRSGHKVRTRHLLEAAQEGADSFLGYQFGLAPLIADIKKLVLALMELSQRVYAQSSHFYETTPTTISINNSLDALTTPPAWRSNNSSIVYGVSSTPKAVGSVVQNYDTRLSCRVAGLARPTPAAQDFLSRADTLLYNLGLQDPELLWDLTSFSWLVDWWAHIGTSISNAYAFSGSGNSVEYAYATTVVRTLATAQVSAYDANGRYGNHYANPHGLAKYFIELKYRRRATPFGFGGSLSSLTSSQMAILTALGLVKTR